jgi:hypothetical protein
MDVIRRRWQFNFLGKNEGIGADDEVSHGDWLAVLCDCVRRLSVPDHGRDHGGSAESRGTPPVRRRALPMALYLLRPPTGR